MLNPNPITDAIVTALLAIPSLSTAMSARIVAHHYRLGTENRLTEVVYAMPAPSMLVAWEGTKGGNYDGQTMWKHKFGIYFRMGNMAGVGSPVGYEDLWWITCNAKPTGSSVNIRYMNLYSGLDIMDTPSVEHRIDEDQIDFFKGVFTIPEIGDQ